MIIRGGRGDPPLSSITWTRRSGFLAPAFVGILFAAAASFVRGDEGDIVDLPDAPIFKAFMWCAVCALVCLSGLFAGLTLGYLGLDKIGLEIIMEAGDPEARRCAKKIAPVRKDGNLLLCSLLFGNVAVNVLISILISDLTSGLVGFFASTILIVVFGDIIPQALCSRFALQIGSKSVYLVRGIEFILYPIAKPMAIMLDIVLGEELGTIHTISELSKLLEIHVKHGSVDPEAGSILSGALRYKLVKVSQVMTPIKDVYALSANDKLDFKTISQIFQSGFSRIPVYGRDRNDILGILLTKDLILLDPDDATPVRNFLAMFGRRPEVFWPDTDLSTALHMFRQGRGHMSLVRDVLDQGKSDPIYVVLGIVTLEDVIEFILGESINDETDSLSASLHGANLLADEAAPQQYRMSRAVSDIGRLRLLDSTLRDEKLDPQEAKAVCSYLLGHIAPFQSIVEEKGTMVATEALTAALEASPVLTLGNNNNNNNHKENQCSLGRSASQRNSNRNLLKSSSTSNRQNEDAAVYKKGKVATCCTVILNGRLTVYSGREGFQCEAGPWTVLAAEALQLDEGKYTPDFTALVPENGEPVRCVQISRTTYQRFLNPSSSTSEAFEAHLERIRNRQERQRSQQRQGSGEIETVADMERARSNPTITSSSSEKLKMDSGPASVLSPAALAAALSLKKPPLARRHTTGDSAGSGSSINSSLHDGTGGDAGETNIL